ncbi:c1 repressor inactivator (plasmid) [Escherichia coli]
MAFIPPTIDDVRHCSNALSVDPAETDAARAIAEHYSKISNQEYRITQDDLDDLTDTIEYLMLPLTSQTHNKCTNKSIIFVGSFYNDDQQLPV